MNARCLMLDHYRKNRPIRAREGGNMASTAEIINLVPDHLPRFNGDGADDKPVLMKPGAYDFVLASYWKGRLYGRSPKLALTFRVATQGPHYGKRITCWYNVKDITKRGEITPKGWTSDFVREYCKLFGAPPRLRDIGIRKFKNKVIRATVRTVTTDRKQRLLPECLHYSVIDELLEVVAG